MDMRNATKGIFKNGVLLSLMMFYFSCGKDVFPPDSPENSFPHALHRVPCTSSNVAFRLQQLGHEDCASSSASDRIVRQPNKAVIKDLAWPQPAHDNRHSVLRIPVLSRLRPVDFVTNDDRLSRS